MTIMFQQQIVRLQSKNCSGNEIKWKKEIM